MAQIETRPLDKNKDWAFFDVDFSISKNSLKLIRPLSKQAASIFWDKHVSNSPGERHPILLPKNHWLTAESIGPSWLDRSLPEVAAFLNSKFYISADEEVFFIYMRENIYSVPYGICVTHWQAFLRLDNEAPFLFHPSSGAYAGFGPHGYLFSGSKKN